MLQSSLLVKRNLRKTPLKLKIDVQLHLGLPILQSLFEPSINLPVKLLEFNLIRWASSIHSSANDTLKCVSANTRPSSGLLGVNVQLSLHCQYSKSLWHIRSYKRSKIEVNGQPSLVLVTMLVMFHQSQYTLHNMIVNISQKQHEQRLLKTSGGEEGYHWLPSNRATPPSPPPPPPPPPQTS